MAHTGHFYIKFQSSVQKPRMLLQCFLIGSHGILKDLCQMHPGAIRIAAESFYQIKILLCADSLIVLSLDQRFSHSEKSLLIVVHIFSFPNQMSSAA